jgi:hypothetical protein
MFQIVALLVLAHFSRAAEICCGNLGCFNDGAPFDQMPLPDCASSFGLRYTMYTRSNQNSGQAVTDTSIPSVFSPSRRTVFMAHGWNSDGTSSWLHTMKNTLLNKEDVNAVIVDWGGGAQVLNYAQAASNTRTTGAYTARVFANLASSGGSATSRFWCIGHSLGSHVCGHTGMRTSLGRVTGMDPAGPLFENNPSKLVGLNPSSASFVDVIHTAEDLGTERDIGHLDFYPAGGRHQPGCFVKESEFSEEFWDSNKELRDSCSHSRAYEFMIESIKSDCFRATQQCSNYDNIPGSCSTCSGCGSLGCAFMGYAADSSCDRSGMYYLTVTGSAPYCTN